MDPKPKMKLYRTPDGVLTAYIYEYYLGLKGQARVGLVDTQGRVHHYDRDEIEDLHRIR